MDMPELSIVVPVYNVEDYIRKCIESILKQKYNDFELILVDDGSTDNSGKICDEYSKKDKRIRVFHKKNGGLSSARNYGLKYIKGKYVGFVDSDDWINEKMYEILMDLACENDADIAQCEFVEVYDDEKIPEGNKEHIIESYNNIEALNNLYKKGRGTSTVVAWNKIYKSILFMAIRFPNGKIHEDEFTMHKLLYMSKKVVYSNEKLYYYRQRHNSIMNSKFNVKNLDLLEALNSRLKFMDSIGQNELYIKTLDRYTWWLVNYYCKVYESLKDNKECINKLSNEMKRVYGIYTNKKIKRKTKIKIKLWGFINIPFIFIKLRDLLLKEAR